MSKSVIGALRVTLGLDSAQFQQGLKTAQSGMQRFASLARTGALAVGAAMVTGAGVMAAAMKGVIDDADKMGKLAQSIGVPIEELSKLRYAADLAGVDLDALGKAVKRLSAGMLDATESATGPAARAFSMLGISIRDAEGKMRPASEVVQDLAGRFARMPDGVEKTALAMRIFGKSGADMIPLLNAGSDGLKEMYEEAEQLGIVLDDQTAKAAEQFNDDLTRLGKVKDGIVTKITAHMLPALAGLTSAFVTTAKNSDLLKRVGTGLGWTLQALATAAVSTAGFFVWLAQGIAMAAEVGAKWASDPTGAVVALAKWQSRMDATMAGTRQLNQAIWNPPPGATAYEQPSADVFELGENVDGARRAVQRLSDAEREAARAAEELRREGERVFEQTRTPAEQYAATVERLTRLLNAAAISQDTFNRAMAEAQKQFEQDDPAQQVIKALEDKRRQFAVDSAEERMNLAQDHRAEMEAATYDGIRGGLEAAADGNLGEYLAMRIRNALFDRLAGSLTDMFLGNPKTGGGMLGSLGSWGSALKTAFSMFTGGFPSFATGGSFRVGGAPGKDKNFVGMNLTKGEHVDIRKPGNDVGPTQIIVTPSPYFDTRVERVASPLAAQAGVQSAGFSRQAVPADQARRQRFSLARG